LIAACLQTQVDQPEFADDCWEFSLLIEQIAAGASTDMREGAAMCGQLTTHL
jgi:hypothetical protein